MDESRPDQTSAAGSQHHPAEGILAEILRSPAGEQIRALDDACAAHPEAATALRDAFALLAGAGLRVDPDLAAFPERLGEFRLVERLGGGGMGVVYLAEQEPLGRLVALKLIRPDQLYFPEARERFRREYEAISKLQHPGIVPIYTVGEAEGIPYFAMERIEGRTLAEVLENLRGLAPESVSSADIAEAAGADPDSEAFRAGYLRTCLRIAKQVADALAHAHERGILHRDVKPSNIIVSADGRARLLDFGLTSSEETERITKTGSQVGTLFYMAPEQLRGETRRLDAGTDVYSLGVTLYEMLTLQVPYSGEDSVSTQNQILEGRPPAILARNRRVSPEAAAVCLKAMDVEPSARYARVADLADDLDNAIALRPVLARPPGLARRLRRFIQRRPALFSAIAVSFLFVIGVPTTLWIQASRHAKALDAAYRKEQVENQVAGQTLVVLEDLLSGASPYKKGGKDAKVVDLLTAAEERVRGDATLVPSVRFRLLQNLGQVHVDLGNYDRAVPLLEEAATIAASERGEESQPCYRALSMLADAKWGRGEREAAIVLKQRAIVVAKKIFGLSGYRVGGELYGLGNFFAQADRNAEAEPLLRESLSIERSSGAPEKEIAAGLATLANVETKLSRFGDAEKHFAEALEIQRRVLPPLHPDVASALMGFAVFLKKQGKLAEAEPLYHEAREKISRIFGDQTEQMGSWALNFGALLEAKGDADGARKRYDESIAIFSATLGEDHPVTRRVREVRARIH